MKEIIKFLSSEENLEKNEINLDKSLFKEISTKESENTIHAIDGGCATIIDGGTWVISKIKIGNVAYKNRKREYENIDSFMLGILKKKKEINWKLNPEVNGFNLIANSTKIDELTNLSRSIIEWLKIKNTAGTAQPGDIILRDGAFTSNEAFEKSIINDTVELCKQRGVYLIGICKTSRISQNDGRPFIGVLNEFASKELPNQKWVYQDENITVAKLHEKSELCFRIESSDNEKLVENLSKISFYASDPELTGYPYPLLKVDKIARVRDFERQNENRKAKMLAKTLGNEFIEFDEKTTIAHNMIDRRAYK